MTNAWGPCVHRSGIWASTPPGVGGHRGAGVGAYAPVAAVGDGLKVDSTEGHSLVHCTASYVLNPEPLARHDRWGRRFLTLVFSSGGGTRLRPATRERMVLGEYRARRSLRAPSGAQEGITPKPGSNQHLLHLCVAYLRRTVAR